MSSLSEMRAELKALRKEHAEFGPVSRMKKGDISASIERLRGAREETPAVAAVPSAAPRRNQPATESIKEAKRGEFPVMPERSEKSTPKRGAPRKARKSEEPSKKMEKADSGASKAELLALLQKMME